MCASLVNLFIADFFWFFISKNLNSNAYHFLQYIDGDDLRSAQVLSYLLLVTLRLKESCSGYFEVAVKEVLCWPGDS